ncbi:hypothetical protein FPRO06_04435 [Fusarium proliferatum]|nr:hypothetical protein FPRO06_04435 [Fusarium proliferatum]CVL05193.1 uncharacterized protein FPRN_03190 [Fusarium proliferatum]
MKKGDITKEDIKRFDSLLSRVFKRPEFGKVSKDVVQSGDYIGSNVLKNEIAKRPKSGDAMDDLEMESFFIEDDDDDDTEM